MDESQQTFLEHYDTDPPPPYTPSPQHSTLNASVRANLNSLSTGPLTDTISVPMLSRTHHKSLHDLNPFSHRTGPITHSITARKMTRETYLKHYVKDAEGNFVGSGSRAPDAGLVFVLGKSTPEDLLRQVQEVVEARKMVRGDVEGRLDSGSASTIGSMMGM